MAMEFVDLREVGSSSEVETYIGIARYKDKLHDCIWRGTAVLAVLLAAGSLLFFFLVNHTNTFQQYYVQC